MMLRRVSSLLSCLALATVGSACGDDAPVQRQVDNARDPTCPCRLATQFENLGLCVSPSTAFAPSHVFSSSWDATLAKPVCEPYRDPQPTPSKPWSGVKVSSSCAGTGQLCISVRAGSATNLSSDDCTLAMVCSDIDYTTPGQIAALAPLAGWSAQSSACALRQEQTGAYLELSLRSDQLGCGMGLEQVTRISVCPGRCQDNPAGPGCDVCQSGALLETL
ncbi:MAG: hypothetical protein JWN48_2854 [Myxococcaceae bacterium]|nr:hypothetical protein [Myxococcaceae bacterium]